MIAQRTRGIHSLLALAQGALATLLFWGVYGLLLALTPGTGMFALNYAGYWAAVIVGLTLEIAVRRDDKFGAPLYESSLVRHFPIALRQLAFSLGALLLLLAITKDLAISRTFLLAFGTLLYPVLLWSSATLPTRFSRLLFRGQRENGTLLVGPAERLPQLDGWLRQKEQLGIRVAGLLTLGGSEAASSLIPVLGTIDRFEEVVADGSISQVILLELARPELVRQLIAQCEQRGIRLLIVNDFAEQVRRPIISRVDEGVNVLMLFEEPLENPFNRVLKRTLDLVFSIPVVFLILPPLGLLVWLLQRLQSPGPLWYQQPRAGLQNRAFTILKFRTMHPDHGNEEQQATSGDARIFSAGRWLRRFSLDEMPQFVNVLRGEMSVVGPRPHLLAHNAQFAEVLANYHVRAFIKPGITGLAQVRGFRGEARTTEDISARLQSDLIYMEHWSLSLDLSIITRTLWQMVRPPDSAR